MDLVKEYDRYKNPLSFILSERFLTITVIGSVFTFQFLSSFKMTIVDPLLDFMLPNESFNFLNVKLRDGVEPYVLEPKKLTLEFGTFFKSLVVYIFIIFILYALATYTRFPDNVLGNITGAAIM